MAKDRAIEQEALADVPVEAPAHPLHAVVDAWFASHFHNSAVARDTEIHNLVHAAVQDLKRRLTQEH